MNTLSPLTRGCPFPFPCRYAAYPLLLDALAVPESAAGADGSVWLRSDRLPIIEARAHELALSIDMTWTRL